MAGRLRGSTTMAMTPLSATGPWTGPGLDKDYMALSKWETGDILECGRFP